MGSTEWLSPSSYCTRCIYDCRITSVKIFPNSISRVGIGIQIQQFVNYVRVLDFEWIISVYRWTSRFCKSLIKSGVSYKVDLCLIEIRIVFDQQIWLHTLNSKFHLNSLFSFGRSIYWGEDAPTRIMPKTFIPVT
jgi:hypothetical protein